MVVTTISGSISQVVWVGYGTYSSPLTITNTGTVAPTGTTGNPDAIIFGIGSGGGTLMNMGTLLGRSGGEGPASRYHGGGGGVAFISVSGEVINSGTIIGGDGGARTAYGAAGDGGIGVLLGAAGSTTLINTGFISGGNGGNSTNTANGYGGNGVYMDGGLLINAGTIAGGAPGVGVNGTATAGFAVNMSTTMPGTLEVEPGAVFIGKVSASTLELSGTSVESLTGIGTQFINFKTIDFEPSAAWTLDGDVSGLANKETINGFSNQDTIDLTDFDATSKSYVSGTGLVLSNSTASATIDIVGSFTTADFSISSDGASGTLIEEVTCYARGTRIATAEGEVAVEDLRIGMRVKTLHAGLQQIKWIGTRSYAAPFANHPKVLPICIRAGAIADGTPARDLFVSPGHAICIDDVLIHASRLINGKSITQASAVDEITYFHVELENHEIIFAENCSAESFRGEYFRPQFHNAAEFSRLYPGAQAPEIGCLPQLVCGLHLRAIQRRLEERAGLCETVHSGTLVGYVDSAGPDLCYGWALDSAARDVPVLLDIFAGPKRVGRVLANMHRADVQQAGFGSGYHGFEFNLDAGIEGAIEVRRAVDGALLPTAGTVAKKAS